MLVISLTKVIRIALYVLRESIRHLVLLRVQHAILVNILLLLELVVQDVLLVCGHLIVLKALFTNMFLQDQKGPILLGQVVLYVLKGHSPVRQGVAAATIVLQDNILMKDLTHVLTVTLGANVLVVFVSVSLDLSHYVMINALFT